MTQEEKQLLLQDLCARLPYGIVVSIHYPTLIIGEKSKKIDIPLISVDLADNTYTVGDLYGKTSGLRMFNRKDELLCKPYLRQMSSMTEEEDKEFQEIKLSYHFDEDSYILLDWLNKKMFDYRGLIPMGLALEAPENMYTKIE